MYKLIKKELCMLCNDHLMPYSGREREAHLRTCAADKIKAWTPEQIHKFSFGGHFPDEVELIIRSTAAALQSLPAAKQANG